MGQIVKKAMVMSRFEAQQTAVLNLMTSDIDTIIDGVGEMFELSLAVPELLAGFYCLRRIVGDAFIFPALCIFGKSLDQY